MKAFDITLSNAGQVSALANITNRYPFTIALRQGRYVVDGKSILGICSLEHTKPIVLEAFSDDCRQLAEDIRSMLC